MAACKIIVGLTEDVARKHKAVINSTEDMTKKHKELTVFNLLLYRLADLSEDFFF